MLLPESAREGERFLFHPGSRRSANNEFSMRGASDYPARAGASSSSGGNPARAGTTETLGDVNQEPRRECTSRDRGQETLQGSSTNRLSHLAALRTLICAADSISRVWKRVSSTRLCESSKLKRQTWLPSSCLTARAP